jgi:nucleotide-binding universal stress UspA family protein
VSVVAAAEDPASGGSASPGAALPFRHALVGVAARGREIQLDPALWELVRFLGVRLTLCHVVMRPTASAGNELDGAAADPEEVEFVRVLRAAAVDGLGDPGRRAEIRILHGDPGQRLCEFAEYARADLIVLGASEGGRLARALRGSVSRYVIANSRRSVLVLGERAAAPPPPSVPTAPPPPKTAGVS